MELFIYDAINPPLARSFAESLRAQPNAPVTVRVNSYGGDLAAGLAMLNALRAHRGSVRVEIEGVAASAATLFCCVGTVHMADNAALMVHSPWVAAAGNARDLRDQADGLDTMAEGMATAYRAKTGKSATEIAQLLDGRDHWFTAAEALACGLIDQIIPALRVAARLGSLKLPERFTRMSDTTPPTAPNVVEIQTAAAQAALAAEQTRRREIRALLTGVYAKREDLRAVMDECLDDPNCSSDEASKRLLRKLGEGYEPMGGSAAVGASPVVVAGGSLGRELRAASRMGNPIAFGGYGEGHFRAAASDALAMRLGAPVKEPHPAAKDFRETSFTGFAAMCLSASGHPTLGKSRASIIKSAMSTSDFPELLSNTANKSLATRVEAITQEHRQLCDKGDLVDFKPAKVVNTSFLPGLERKLEAGEIKYGAISDGSETYQLLTYARGLVLSRESLVNDDLDGFGALLRTAANTAARLERDLVFGALTSNGVMSDGIALFHANHGNLDTNAHGVDISGLNAARVLMRKQQDSSGGYVLTDPRYLVVPVGLEADAEALTASLTYRPGSNTELQTPAWVKSLAVVSDPRLDAASASVWYLLSSPTVAAVIRLGYLNGQTTPEVEQEIDFDRDTLRFKIRFDVACAAIGWAGGVKMA